MSEGIVVIGASGGIGAALVTHWLAEGVGPVIAISRQPAPAGASSPALQWLCCDYSDEQMAAAVARIAELAPRPHRVVICNGILHQGEIQPEKRLEAINLDAMTRLYQTNALLPLRWISQLLPLFGHEPCTLAVLSARVGSIGDNRASGRLVWLSRIQGSPQHAAQVCRHRAGPAGSRRQIAGLPSRHRGYPTLSPVSRQRTGGKRAKSRAGSRPSGAVDEPAATGWRAELSRLAGQTYRVVEELKRRSSSARKLLITAGLPASCNLAASLPQSAYCQMAAISR